MNMPAENNQKSMEDSLQDLDNFKEQLAEATSINEDLQNELTALYRQFDSLKMQIAIQSNEKNEYLKIIKQQQGKLDQQHNPRYSKNDKQQESLNLQIDALMAEKANWIEKFDLLELKCECLENEKMAFQLEKEILKKDNEEGRQLIQQISEQLETSIHEREQLAGQCMKLQEEFSLQNALREEKEMQLEEARQHVGKKMREVALAQLKVEEYTQKIEEQIVHEKRLESDQKALYIEWKMSEEKNQELLKTISLLENTIKKWEQDWLLIEQQKQTVGAYVTELMKGHAQLQNLLLGFNQSESKMIAPQPLQFGVLPQESIENSKESVSDTFKPYACLFDLPQTPSRPKQTLFD